MNMLNFLQQTSPIGMKREADNTPSEVTPAKLARKVLSSGRVLGVQGSGQSAAKLAAGKASMKAKMVRNQQQLRQQGMAQSTPPRQVLNVSNPSMPLSTSTPKSNAQGSAAGDESSGVCYSLLCCATSCW